MMMLRTVHWGTTEEQIIIYNQFPVFVIKVPSAVTRFSHPLWVMAPCSTWCALHVFILSPPDISFLWRFWFFIQTRSVRGKWYCEKCWWGDWRAIFAVNTVNTTLDDILSDSDQATAAIGDPQTSNAEFLKLQAKVLDIKYRRYVSKWFRCRLFSLVKWRY